MKKQKTKAEWIAQRPNSIYNYDLLPDGIIGSHEMITIQCPISGPFEQRCYAHFTNLQNSPAVAQIIRDDKMETYNANKKTQAVYTNNHGCKYRIYDHHNKPTHWISDNVTTDQVNQSYGYTYIITNLVNNKQYIGKRKVGSMLKNTQHNSWQSYKRVK